MIISPQALLTTLKKNNQIKLMAIFDSKTAFHLSETPLSNDQKLVKKWDGRIQVTATVKNTSQLRWWLLGFGKYVEVVKPKSLRDEFIETVNQLYNMYSGKDTKEKKS